ncbi:hypothetical protein C8Q77DRAFT_1077471 [Trametes polyzona]|nr:hypothetical protein C8Q77DRAFT_1077471 [Trametes polyzona]
MRTSALAGGNMLFCGVMVVLSLGVILYDGIYGFDITPVNLPSPDNCTFVSNINGRLTTA